MKEVFEMWGCIIAGMFFMALVGTCIGALVKVKRRQEQSNGK